MLRNQTEAMSIKTSTGLENSGTAAETDDEPSIEGPIPEFDRFGDYTGHEYFRCTGCGVEAMRRRDLRDGGYKFDLLPRQPVGFSEGEFKIARFLSPQGRFCVGRLTVAARLRPRACVPARPARSNGPSHPDAPGASTERNTTCSSTVGYSADWVPPFASDP